MTTYRARVLTSEDPDRVVIIDDAVVVVDEAGLFKEIGSYDGRAVDQDLRPGLLAPGFVDGHLHYPQTRVMGAANGPLLTWLERTVFPEEARFADGAYAEEVARQFCEEMARAGTTTALVYGSSHEVAAHKLFEALDSSGLRAIAGPVLMDHEAPAPLHVSMEPALETLEALAERWHGHDGGRLQVAAIPRFALSCTEALLRSAADLALRHQLWVSTHMAENKDECRAVDARFGGQDYLAVYEDAGLIHERSVIAHCIHMSESMWERMAASGAVVAHCPDSNDFLGSGGMNIEALMRREIPMVMGTDVAAGRSFQIARTLSSAYDNARRHGADISAERLFWWGTRGGAESLGHDKVGRIAPGFEADMVLYDMPSWIEGVERLLGTLLFHHDEPKIQGTWVRGKTVWRAM